MKILGIESTAHTLGIGVVEDYEVLSNELDTYRAKEEGIIPRKAADHHENLFLEILENSLKSANTTMDEIDLIAFAQGPGIGAPLKVGIVAAKYLAMKYSKKIIGVNHPYAHVKISEQRTGIEKPLVLYVSGGNTQILVENDPFEFQVLGETFDIGMGNLFDNFARKLGIKYAWGSELAKMAEKGKYVELPYTVKGMNLTFSGLLTHAERLIGKYPDEDLAHSIMETAFSQACEALERALYLTKREGVIVCGGVAQNTRLKEMLTIMCEEDGVQFGACENQYNRDNGAMIALAGGVLYEEFGDKPAKDWVGIQDYRITKIKEVLQ